MQTDISIHLQERIFMRLKQEDSMEEVSKKGPVDEARVNIQDENELRFWADKFRVSKAAVIRAVEIVGVMAKDVNEFLNGRVA